MSRTITPPAAGRRCRACGATLRFAPGDTALACGHCGTRIEIAPWGWVRGAALHEFPLAPVLQQGPPPEAMEEVQVIDCPGCGAEMTFDAQLKATDCPFCTTPLVRAPHAERHLAPQGVVPFAVTEARAQALMEDWLRGMVYKPPHLLRYARRERRMQGVYLPFFTFDARSETEYRGPGKSFPPPSGEKHSDPVEVEGPTVAGRLPLFLDDMLVPATESLPRVFLEGTAAWNLAGLQPFRTEILAGFRANLADRSIADGYHEARSLMRARVDSALRRAIGGQVQTFSYRHTVFADETFKQILLPVWIAAYRYQGRVYRVVVNGQTGEVRGDRPFPPQRQSHTLIVAAAAALLFLLWLARG